MTRFFTRERFGRPQFLAGALLAAFLAQAIWLVHSESHPAGPPTDAGAAPEQLRIAAGWQQLRGDGIAGAPYPAKRTLPRAPNQDADKNDFDTQHSPLLSL